MNSSLRQRNDLIEEYQDFVQTIVRILVRSLHIPEECEDEMISAGYLGLVEAAERFDFSRGANFRTFARHRVRGAIIDNLRKNSTLSRKSYRYTRILEAMQFCRYEDLDSFDGTACDEDSVRDGLARVLDYAAKGALAFRISMNTTDEKVGEFLTDERDPEVVMEEKQCVYEFKQIIEDLPEKEQLIIREYYFRDKTFAEIVREHEGFSKSWVSKLHNRAIDRIKDIYVQRKLVQKNETAGGELACAG